MIEIIEFLAGLVIVFAVLNDVFQSVVVPRPSPWGVFRLTRLVIRGSWRVWRNLGLRAGPERRERMLGTFAPRVLIGLLLVWILGLVLGFGLMLYALRTQTHPPLENLLMATYYAGTSLLTIGYGDIVAQSALARLVSITAAVAGSGWFQPRSALFFLCKPQSSAARAWSSRSMAAPERRPRGLAGSRPERKSG